MDLAIDVLIAEAKEHKASDIHLVCGSPVIFRIFSKLQAVTGNPITPEGMKTLIQSVCDETQLKRFEAQKDLDFGYVTPSGRVRINLHLQRGSPALAIRLINSRIPNLEDIQLPVALQKFCKLSRGLVLVTGPTGSGKSTTQASLIRRVSETRGVHIVTVEDPIEYEQPVYIPSTHTVIEQRELGTDTGTFASALKHVLRQDPDVILVGELRDYETISIALTAAETGHLVISTLHTLDAVQSIDRMIDVFPPNQQMQARVQLSMVLEGICSQRVLARKDGKGLLAATELMFATSGIRNLIRTAKAAEIYSMIEIGREHGMHTMDDSLEQMIKAGLVTFEECRPHVKRAERFAKYGNGEKIRAA
jgi:twitching motility protein PilT